ncbi:MAG: hypothetical protein HYZ81_03070 [Nitrospinae bacterium]|nr:hypothetical protein [Nitrospinota bacterium]
MAGGRHRRWVFVGVVGLLFLIPGWLWAQQPKSGGTLRIAWEAEYSRLGREIQEYLYKNMIYMSATSLPSLQAAREYVQGYVYERGFKVRFETTWLNK